MNKGLSFFNGIIIAFMVLVNGLLSAKYGNLTSLVIIYSTGLTVSFIVVLIRKDLKSLRNTMPKYLYISGVIGVINIFLNNVCMNAIGVSRTLAFCLAGQIIFSVIFEHFGLFGIMKKKITLKKLPGYLLIVAGVVVMIVGV